MDTGAKSDIVAVIMDCGRAESEAGMCSREVNAMIPYHSSATGTQSPSPTFEESVGRVSPGQSDALWLSLPAGPATNTIKAMKTHRRAQMQAAAALDVENK